MIKSTVSMIIGIVLLICLSIASYMYQPNAIQASKNSKMHTECYESGGRISWSRADICIYPNNFKLLK